MRDGAAGAKKRGVRMEGNFGKFIQYTGFIKAMKTATETETLAIFTEK